jgi:hypothetical protein
MKLGIPLLVNWFVKWLALTFEFQDLSISTSNYYEYDNSYGDYNQLSVLQEKTAELQSHSEQLLSQLLTRVPFHELESFSPQLCNIIVDRNTIPSDLDQSFAAQVQCFEEILENKCSDSLLFGIHLCNMLKVIKCLF